MLIIWATSPPPPKKKIHTHACSRNVRNHKYLIQYITQNFYENSESYNTPCDSSSVILQQKASKVTEKHSRNYNKKHCGIKQKKMKANTKGLTEMEMEVSHVSPHRNGELGEWACRAARYLSWSKQKRLEIKDAINNEDTPAAAAHQ
jgi:hypothetical protein